MDVLFSFTQCEQRRDVFFGYFAWLFCSLDEGELGEDMDLFTIEEQASH